MRVGLIKNRHPMQVDDYLILKGIPVAWLSEEGFKNELVPEVQKRVRELVHKSKGESVELYLTGLTAVAVVAIAAFHEYTSNSSGHKENVTSVKIMNWDASKKVYFEIAELTSIPSTPQVYSYPVMRI